jgi:putative ABC transport system permease protein
MAGIAYVAALMGAFGLMAVSLAVIGIYSVKSYYVTERTREIGVRVALGATRRDVFRLIVGKGAVLASIGLALGFGLATLVARWLASLIYGVGANDVRDARRRDAAAGRGGSCRLRDPAHRAARLDPLVCLRSE